MASVQIGHQCLLVCHRILGSLLLLIYINDVPVIFSRKTNKNHPTTTSNTVLVAGAPC